MEGYGFFLSVEHRRRKETGFRLAAKAQPGLQLDYRRVGISAALSRAVTCSVPPPAPRL